MTDKQHYNFDLPKGSDIIDFIQNNGFAPEEWDGLKSLYTLPRKRKIRKRLATVIRSHAVAVPAEWVDSDPWLNPDLSVLNAESHVPPKLPRHLFGDFWGALIGDKADACSAPEDYVALSLLVTTGGLIGNARRAMTPTGWKESPILWGVIVGKPGTSKTQALGSILDYILPIELRYKNEYEEELKEWEKIQRIQQNDKRDKKTSANDDETDTEDGASKPICKRITISDATVEIAAIRVAENPKGLICARDEIAGLIGGFGRYSGKGDAERSFWLECYNGRSHKVDRVTQRDHALIIPYLSIAILGGTQPDKLRDIFMSGDDDGLAARFLYVWPERTWLKFKKEHTKNNARALAAIERLAGLEMAAGDEGSVPVNILVSAKAGKKLYKWAKSIEKRHDHHTGLIAGHFAKYRGMALRMALVLEYLWWSCQPGESEPSKISLNAIKSAIKMLETYFEPMAIRSFADAAIPQEQRNAASLAKWIKKLKPEMVNARSLYKNENIDGLNDAAAVKDAIALLMEAGWIRSCSARKGDTAGRMRSDYEVNPRVYK